MIKPTATVAGALALVVGLSLLRDYVRETPGSGPAQSVLLLMILVVGALTAYALFREDVES